MILVNEFQEATVELVALKILLLDGGADPEITTSDPVVANWVALMVLVELVMVLLVKVSVVSVPIKVVEALGKETVRVVPVVMLESWNWTFLVLSRSSMK